MFLANCLLALELLLEQRFSVPDIAKKKRKWMGLVCPVCRFVFRVPKEHDGNGVICPACNHLLNLPESGAEGNPMASGPGTKTLAAAAIKEKETKPIVARSLDDQDKRASTPAGNHAAQQRDGGRRVRMSSAEAAPTWDQRSESQAGKPSSPVIWIVGGVVLCLLGSFLAARMVFDHFDKGEQSVEIKRPPLVLPPIEPDPEKDGEMAELDEERKKEGREIRASVRTGASILVMVEDVVRKFLEAPTMEEAAKYVRSPDITVPRMHAWYADTPWKPRGVEKIGVKGQVNVRGKMASITVQLGDFSYREIALEQVGDEYKIDWESWVIWSEIPWNQIFEKKPTEPTTIRVEANLDSYYNRYFNDESKWVSVKLLHPYEDRILYGYIEKTDPMFVRLVSDLRDPRKRAVMLKVKYLEESPANDQVQIVEYFQSGWVLPSSDEKTKGETTPQKPQNQ